MSETNTNPAQAVNARVPSAHHTPGVAGHSKTTCAEGRCTPTGRVIITSLRCKDCGGDYQAGHICDPFWRYRT